MFRRTLLATVAGATLMAVSGCISTSSSTPDIVDVVTQNPQFSTLASAVQAAGLVDTLRGDGPFTVLAPTDSAFAKLPAGTLDQLLAEPGMTTLKSILTTHVVAQEIPSVAVTESGITAEAVNGQELRAVREGDQVRVNGARVTQADIEASNGVIHVIDTVILPK
ncbi:fasciclin domain-containing protein [Palleronia caenipelagi]|uniref:Fasciclin domain-containing protein n=1 Tax=Palleronia caenipelagi TaxID=2489174 RepID=A0A547PMZ2_9RHOB|nr:fasciclin domain-containing protein [Palleronia caenipelagi]TRD15513.1 fasciclin domain-containing protein [Palleronia caenipelagi]